MGHYRSEMHVETPHEEFRKKVDSSLLELGFTRFEVGHKSCFMCQACSCIIVDPAIHLLSCKPGLKENRIRAHWHEQIYYVNYIVRNQLKDRPTEQLQFLAMIGTRRSAFALDMMLKQLATEKVISYTQDTNNPYSDRVYLLVVPNKGGTDAKV